MDQVVAKNKYCVSSICVSLCDATAYIWPRLHHGWGFYIKNNYTNSVELLWATDGRAVYAAKYATHNRHKRQASMSSAAFELNDFRG